MSQKDLRSNNSDPSVNHQHHHHHHHHDDSFGDFQANVGRASAKASIVGAWIFAVLLGIIAIIMAIFAFIPTYKDDCQDDLESARRSLSNCKEAVKTKPGITDKTSIPNTCDDEKDQVSSLTKTCKKSRNYLLLIGLIMIPLGVLVVWGAKAWDRKVQSSRSAAQFGGALTEASIVSDMMQR